MFWVALARSNAPKPGPWLDAVDDPAFGLPASPWTTLVISDDLASHLVSLFLTVANPYWRSLEADVFAKEMRERKVQSEYCSPFLVSAILSRGSVELTPCYRLETCGIRFRYFSNDDGASIYPGQFFTRGEHLHKVKCDPGRSMTDNLGNAIYKRR